MEPSKAVIDRANELIAGAPRDSLRSATFMALLSFVERVDRVAREAVDQAKSAGNADKRGPRVANILREIMLPDPEPDPLVEAIKACDLATLEGIEREKAEELRQALTAAGYEIRKVEP